MTTLRCWTGTILAAVLLLNGCALFQKAPTTRLWFHEETNPAVPAKHKREVTIPVSNLRVVVDPHPTLTERDVAEAEIVETAGGDAVLVKFNAHGRMALDQLTTQGRGQYLVVFLNNRAIAAWQIDRRLSLGQFLIEADLSDADARQLVDDLNRLARINAAP